MSRWVAHVGEILASPWSIALATILGGLVAGRLLALIARPLLARAARRSAAAWDDQLVAAATTPFSVIVALQALHVVAPWLPLPGRARDVVLAAIALATTTVVLWLAFRLVDVVRAVLEGRAWAESRPAARSLLAIAARVAKVIIVLITGIIALSHLGVAVSGLLAGLGLGGLAVALAAQKTVENLFGTLAIGIDQPLREGDFVKVGDVVGTVEALGLRSTRIRTLDRTLVTIPNGQLADRVIESFAVRDRLRLACTLGLVYETTGPQLRATLAGLEAALRAHPKIWPGAVVVRFAQYAASSLDVEIMAWFETSDWSEFQLIRQDVLLQFMDVIARSGTSFAFPTRTVHLARAAEAHGPRPDDDGDRHGAGEPQVQR